MTWTSSEVRYLEEHAGDGAVAIAEALGKTVRAVEVQASKYGLSLRIVAREGYRLPAQERVDRQRDAFRAGLLVGITVTALAMCALLWLWIIPTMDGAVHSAQAAYEAVGVHA